MDDCWNKTHTQVLYKGIDITKEIGLCICENCTKHIRKRIDLELENKRLKTSIKKTTKD